MATALENSRPLVRMVVRMNMSANGVFKRTTIGWHGDRELAGTSRLISKLTHREFRATEQQVKGRGLLIKAPCELGTIPDSDKRFAVRCTSEFALSMHKRACTMSRMTQD